MKMILMITMVCLSSSMDAQDSIKNNAAKDSSKNTINNEYDKTFTKTEIEAEYPGGKDAWGKFLIKNMRYPDDAINNEIQGVVYIQFIVDKEGNTSDIIPVSGPTKGGLREEGVRMIKLSGKWIPAIQNGRQVKAYKKVPFVFKLSKG